MNKNQPNLDLLYDKVLEFNEIQPGEYFDSTLYYLSENTSHIHNIFDNLTAVFGNNPSLLNALKVVFLIVARLGAPAFFGLEGSRIPELHPDPTTQHNELLELKRIMKYCLERFQKMQTAHEIPNIAQKYAELCQITQEDVLIGELQLTEFEKKYSELAVKFQQFEQRLEVLISECQENKDNKTDIGNAKLLQLLEQIDVLVIQPEQGFTKSENELILNFFHQKYALINKIHNEFPQIAQEYQKVKEEKKAKKQQEKGEEDQRQPQDQQIQNIKDFTYFVEGTTLAAFPESMSIEYKDYIYPFRNEELKKKMKATICAFLNTNGGRILIGVGNTGFRVKGLFLTTNDQDTLIRDIDALLKDFHPKVDPEEVTTTFVPIKKRDNSYKPGFYVVKIIVKRGKPNDLYFVGRDCYKRRNGQNDVQMPSNFKRDIIDRLAINPELFRDKGEFNDPLPELGIPVTNVKEKRTPETKPAKAVGGVKQKQGVQIATGTTKLLIKNLPNRPDVGIELKNVLDTIQPLTKTLHFNKDNDVVIAFMKVEDTRMFLEYVEGNPIVIGASVLQFAPKPLDKDKEKVEKNKVKVEVDEEKKDPAKVKAESSNIIWVRGIPENTNDLKEKLMAILGEYASILKDIKIHNKKKRATLEFETSIQANHVFTYLNTVDRFIGENKVTFEKASPPSSPNQASKPVDTRPIEPAKTKETAKVVEPAKPKEIKKSESLKDGGKGEAAQVVETNVLKISNVPLEEDSQEIGYLVKACSGHIKKSVEKKMMKDFILFTFKDKEDAVKAYNFMVQNNFSFRGKKLKVDYYSPPQPKVEKPKNKVQVPGQANNNNPAVAPGLGQEAQINGVQNVDLGAQNRIPGAMYGNFMQPELQGQGMIDYQMHQQQQFNPFVMQGHSGYPQEPNFMNSQGGPQFNAQFDMGYHQGGYDPFVNAQNAQRPQQQTGGEASSQLHAAETIQPESIQFNIQGANQTSDVQQPHPSSQNSGVQSNTSTTQNQNSETQPSTTTPAKETTNQAQTQGGSNQDSTQKLQPAQPIQPVQPIQPSQPSSQASEYQNNSIMNQQNANSNFPQYQQGQLNQNIQASQNNLLPQLQVPNQQNFIQDQKNLNQQNAYQYQQQPQIGNQISNNKPSPTNSNQIPSTGFPEQISKPNISQNQQVNPMFYNQFPQQQFNQQFGNVQQNIPQPNGQYQMNNIQQNTHMPKNIPQNPYQQQGINQIQNNNYPNQWQQNQPQGVNQQQFNTYPMQQFNQGQQFVQPQMQNMKNMGQYGMQQNQYPMQPGQFMNQTPQYPFPGTFNQGNLNQLDQTNQANIQQNANLQATKNASSENLPKKPVQNPLQAQGQMQGQGQMPIMNNQQGFGGPSYYSGFPQTHLQNNFSYGQQMGYNQNQNNQNMIYGNIQGQPVIGNPGLTPQQMQQMQMQQLQYGGQSSPFMAGKNPAI